MTTTSSNSNQQKQYQILNSLFATETGERAALYSRFYKYFCSLVLELKHINYALHVLKCFLYALLVLVLFPSALIENSRLCVEQHIALIKFHIKKTTISSLLSTFWKTEEN